MHIFSGVVRRTTILLVIVIAIAFWHIGDARAEYQSSPAITELKFRELFKLPVGPGGLEPTEKLLSLKGARVRIVGYMVRQEDPLPDKFILSPFPITMGDADDSLADDLPPTIIFVRMNTDKNQPVPFTPGLITVTGILSLGPQEEAAGRVSFVRLSLDPAPVHE